MSFFKLMAPVAAVVGSLTLAGAALADPASAKAAVDSAKAAGVDALVLNHLVPPQPLAYGYPAFLGDAKKHFDGPITVGEDGMLFSLPQGGDRIIRRRLF